MCWPPAEAQTHRIGCSRAGEKALQVELRRADRIQRARPSLQSRLAEQLAEVGVEVGKFEVEAGAGRPEAEVDKLEAEMNIPEVGMEPHRAATEADKLAADLQQQLMKKK